jgi:hypothetical protein
VAFTKHKPETRERIRRSGKLAWARRQAQLNVTPTDLRRLKRGDVAPHHAHLLEEARAEASALYEALGGYDAATPQQTVVLQDLVRVGVVLRAELVRFLRHGDVDAGARVGTLASVRRASIALLGLERAAKDIDLRSYLASRGEPEAAKAGDLPQVTTEERG